MDEHKGAPGSPIVMENRAREWVLALALHLFFFVLMLEYHRWRGRGYLTDLRSFLFVGNKAAAIAAVFSMGCALSAGPLNRLLGLPVGLLRLRRPLGVVGAAGLLPHVMASLFFLGWKFDLKYHGTHWLSTVLGAAALAGFAWLALLSWRPMLERLGAARWKAWQRAGYAMMAVAFLHAAVFTGKLANWPDWFRKMGQPGNAPVPPGSFVTALCVAAVLGLKAADWARGRKE
jgi:DMSO/TMAO reductase YedYZ heme-binding membrane subunit